jgi:PHD-finger/Protein of unknown function (DUF1759)
MAGKSTDPPGENTEEKCQLCTGKNTASMVACDQCNKWFHFKCVGVTSEISDKPWSCVKCSELLNTPKPEDLITLKPGEGSSTSSEKSPKRKEDDDEVSEHDDDDAMLLLTQLERSQEEKESLMIELLQEKEARTESERQFSEKLSQMEKTISTMTQQSQGGEMQALETLSGGTENANGLEKRQNGSEDIVKEGSGKENYRKRLLELQQRQESFAVLRRMHNTEDVKSEKPLPTGSNLSTSKTGTVSTGLPATVEENPLNKLVVSMNRPFVRKLPTFDGKVREWPVFIAMYEATTRDGAFSEADNVGRLREALKGDALKYVLGLLQFSTKATEVIEALRKVYGRTDILIVELTEELLTIGGWKVKLTKG